MIVVAEQFQEEPGATAAARLLDGHRPVTAIVAANDLLALGAYDALSSRGLVSSGRCECDRIQRYAILGQNLATTDFDNCSAL